MLFLLLLSTYNARNTYNIPLFEVKYNFFQNSFFPSLVIEWNKLEQNIRTSESLNVFKKTGSYVHLEAMFPIAIIQKELSY